MKRILTAAFYFLLLSELAIAQTTETFDIATFPVPAGWKKQVKENVMQLSIDDSAEAYCLITLFKSVPSVGSSTESFNASWDTIVKEAVPVNAKAQMIPADNKEDWKALGGYSPFEKDGAEGVVVLLNIS